MPNALLNLLFPPQCLHCSVIVPTHGTLCTECWQQISFITDPQCACCGMPFDFNMGDHALCGECLRELPPYTKARAVFRYNEHSRAMILKFKYGDHTQLSAILGRWLASAGKEIIAQSDVIVPIPLHYWRFVKRRYNQSALLAQSIAAYSGSPLLIDGLKRRRATPPQTGLSREQRDKNVRGAFEVPEKYKAQLRGKTILLIDDVMTTGSTIKHCSKALLKAGATQVNVLTLARTTYET